MIKKERKAAEKETKLVGCRMLSTQSRLTKDAGLTVDARLIKLKRTHPNLNPTRDNLLNFWREQKIKLKVIKNTYDIARTI